jgi:hypothetical protein
MEITEGQIREALFDHIRDLYARKTRPGFITRLAMFLGEKKPIQGLIIAERESGDEDNRSYLCSGAVLRAWALDADGLQPINPPEAKPDVARGRYWPRGLVEFFILKENRGVIVNDWDGPGKGMLYSPGGRMRGGRLTLRAGMFREVDSRKKSRGAHGGPP